MDIQFSPYVDYRKISVTFLNEKTFSDGSKILKLKNSYEYSFFSKSNITRKLNESIKTEKRKQLIDEYNDINTILPDREIERKKHIIELQLNERNLDSIRRSVYRTKQELYDILLCNDFYYFVTVTFDKLKINRLDDSATRKEWTRWIFNFKRRFPNAYYVAVPEYHKKGGLHFHILIGGIDFNALEPVHAYDNKKKRYMYVKKGRCAGDKIYNVMAWQSGWSTLTVIRDKSAVKHYVSKYITKQCYDSRFFGKKRYYVSRNIVRPEVKKEKIYQLDCDIWDIDTQKWHIDYIDYQKQYGIFSYKPPKKYDFYGFFEDSKECKVSLKQGGRQRTMRKSLLKKLEVPKKYYEYRQRFLLDFERLKDNAISLLNGDRVLGANYSDNSSCKLYWQHAFQELDDIGL